MNELPLARWPTAARQAIHALVFPCCPNTTSPEYCHTKGETEKNAWKRKRIRSVTDKRQWVILRPRVGWLSGNSSLGAGSVSLAHPVASRLWEHKQIEFFSVLSKNRKSQVASLCCQLGSPALRVQDTQRAWKAACVPRGCSGSTRVKGLEPFLINFLMHRSPPGDRAGSIAEREVGDP